MTNRKKWIDQARGVGIILMILGHCNPHAALNKFIYSFHMALFFIISGYLYKERDENFKECGKRLFKSYYVVYFIYSVMNLFLHRLVYLFFLPKAEYPWLSYIYGIIICSEDAGRLPNCGPLWFLPCLFWSSLLLYMYKHFISDRKKKGAVILITYILIVICTKTQIFLPFKMEAALYGFLCMVIGNILREKIKLWRLKIYHFAILLFIGLMSCFINPIEIIQVCFCEYGCVMLSLFSGTCLSVCVLHITRMFFRKCSFLEYMGQNTIFIIVFDGFIGVLVRLFFVAFGMSSAYFGAVCRIGIMFVAIKTVDKIGKKIEKH